MLLNYIFVFTGDSYQRFANVPSCHYTCLYNLALKT